MRVTAHETYVSMFQVIDAAYDDMSDDEKEDQKNDELIRFLSSSNPFLFTDGGSADPAIFSEFEEAFNETFSELPDEKQSFDFVREYLQKAEDPVVLSAFDSVATLENWRSALNA